MKSTVNLTCPKCLWRFPVNVDGPAMTTPTADTPTPRTEAAIVKTIESIARWHKGHIYSSDAKLLIQDTFKDIAQLERELTAALADNARLRDALTLALPHINHRAIDRSKLNGPIDDAFINTICRKALNSPTEPTKP